MDAKQQVLNYLVTDRSFEAGRKLYSTLPGKNRSVEARLSQRNDSPGAKQTLYYELSKAVALPQGQFNRIMASPVQEPDTSKEKVKELDYFETLAKVNDLGLELPDRKKETVFSVYAAYLKGEDPAKPNKDILSSEEVSKLSWEEVQEKVKQLALEPAGRKRTDLEEALNSHYSDLAAQKKS